MDTPNTSSFAIIFSHDFSHVLTGTDNHVRKFGGGTMEWGDFAAAKRQVQDALVRTLFREIKEEFGMTRECFASVPELVHSRNWEKRDGSMKVPVSQHFFHLIAKAGARPSPPADSEMVDVKFSPLGEVVQWWSLPRGDQCRLNPYHAIALGHAVVGLKKQINGNSGFAAFNREVETIEASGICIEFFAQMLQDLIDRREL